MYYSNTLLTQQQLLAMRKVYCEFFCFKKNNVPFR